jgi:hypothetical protein
MATFLLGGGQSQLDGLLVSGTTQLSGPATFSNQPQITTPQSMVQVNTANGYGSTNTVIRRFTNVTTNQGSDITYADSATLGASFTINTSGVYAISYSDNFTGTSTNMGISLNSNQLTTSIATITAANRLVGVAANGANLANGCSWTGYIAAGGVVRAHTDSNATGSGVPASFTITRVS